MSRVTPGRQACEWEIEGHYWSRTWRCPSGPEVARRLAAVRPGVKVLYLSGYADAAVVRHGLLAAGSHFLQKPFARAAFVQKVRDMLTGSG